MNVEQIDDRESKILQDKRGKAYESEYNSTESYTPRKSYVEEVSVPST